MCALKKFCLRKYRKKIEKQEKIKLKYVFRAFFVVKVKIMV